MDSEILASLKSIAELPFDFKGAKISPGGLNLDLPSGTGEHYRLSSNTYFAFLFSYSGHSSALENIEQFDSNVEGSSKATVTKSKRVGKPMN